MTDAIHFRSKGVDKRVDKQVARKTFVLISKYEIKINNATMTLGATQKLSTRLYKKVLTK